MVHVPSLHRLDEVAAEWCGASRAARWGRGRSLFRAAVAEFNPQHQAEVRHPPGFGSFRASLKEGNSRPMGFVVSLGEIWLISGVTRACFS